MRNIPINLAGYRLMVTELPAIKTRKNDDGDEEVVTDRETKLPKFVVSLFAKVKGQKGEEIRVTMEADPGEGFEEGDRWMARIDWPVWATWITDAPTLLPSMTVLVPVDMDRLPTPRYRQGVPDTAAAKAAVRALVRMVNALVDPLLYLLDAEGQA